MRAVGFFCEHPLQATLHHEPLAMVQHTCPHCPKTFSGSVRRVLNAYRDHVLDSHFDELEDECGCCGGFHFPEFDGDCREDWERF